MHHPTYRPDIDGLRAIAVLIVVGYHSFPSLVPGGFIGVDVFFIISGFLISTIIVQNLKANDFSFIDFYCRRIRRIFPSLLLMLVAALVLGWLFFIPEDYEKLGKHTFGGAFFVSNLVSLLEFGYFDVAAEFKPLLHLWSLGIEEQFYIVWPVVLWLAWRFKVWIPALIGLGIFGSFGLDVYKSGFDTTFAFFSPKTRAWELLLGAALGYFGLYGQAFLYPMKQGLRNALSLLGLSLLAFGCTVIDATVKYPGGWALLPTIAAVCVIAAGSRAAFNASLLSNRLLVGVGLISYPLYLWHWLLLAVANVANPTHPSGWLRSGLVGLSFVLAYATYRFVEIPLRRSQRIRTVAGLLFIGLIAVGWLGLSIFKAQGLFGQTHQPRLVTAQAMEYCAAEFKAHQLCVLGNLNSAETLLVYGDSQAEQLSVALNERLGSRYRIVFAFYAGCFMGDTQRLATPPTEGCRAMIGQLKNLKDEPIAATIRVQQWHGYGLQSPADINRAVNDTLGAFGLSAQQTIIVGGVASVDIRCAKWNYYFSDLRLAKICNNEQSSIDQVKSFEAATQQMPTRANVHFVHPYRLLCKDAACLVIKDGVQYYSDANHLTKDGAKLVVSDIATILDNLFTP